MANRPRRSGGPCFLKRTNETSITVAAIATAIAAKRLTTTKDFAGISSNRRPGQSSHNVCRTTHGKTRCSGYRPPAYWWAKGETKNAPCRFAGSFERSGCGSSRKSERRQSCSRNRVGRTTTAKLRSLQFEPGSELRIRKGWPARRKYSAGRRVLDPQARS